MLIKFWSTNFWVPKIFEKNVGFKKILVRKNLSLKKFKFKHFSSSLKLMLSSLGNVKPEKAEEVIAGKAEEDYSGTKGGLYF